MNDWDSADEIFNGIYGGKLDLTFSNEILQSLFTAIKWFVDPLYKKLDVTTNFQNLWSSIRVKSKKEFKEYFEDDHH